MPLRGALRRLGKPKKEKIEARLLSLQDRMWELKTAGKDTTTIRDNINKAKASLASGDLASADYYLFEAAKLAKSLK